MKQLRILISRPDRIGDVVLSTFMPREIKKRYPESSVALLLRSYTAPLYAENPYVDKIIIAEDYPSNFSLIKEIRKYKFSHSIMLLPTEKHNWIFWAAGIVNRIGVGHKFYQFITGTKSTYRRGYIPLRHEAEYCADSLRKIDIEPKTVSPEIYLSEHERKEAKLIRKNLNPDNKFLIGINSTSGKSAPNLTPSVYAQIVTELKSMVNVVPVITDYDPPVELRDLQGVPAPNISLPLRESIKNFAALDLLISASTGPMHLAAALNVKTLSVFCPLTACSPKLWGPLRNEGEVILPSAGYCASRCPGDPKKCNFSGEGGIDSAAVITRLKHMLQV